MARFEIAPVLARRRIIRGGSTLVRFPAAVLFEGTDDNPVIMQIWKATVGLPWGISVSSSGGGTPVTASGTVATANFTTSLNLTGLNAGTLTATYSEDSIAVATGTALLLVPFEYGLLDFSKIESSQYVSLI